MAFVNQKNKEIQAKIVYYGPGMGGKTTNLEYIHRKFHNRIDSDMVCIRTHGDRTLFFDFLPFDIGNIMGYSVRIQIYTVPGQVSYNATRKLVLKGADGVVFVADSTSPRRDNNLYSLKNLQENLGLYRKDLFKIPLVFQYNKRDLKDGPLLSVKTMEKDLNSRLKAPCFEASALNGVNVAATLKAVISRTMSSLEHMIR
ncbi:GTPase domain-containing protein [Desulfobacterales bacterium HSG2]|nr:GTPase domain-containing protein [Desulfobacterales bacterium HSG2]